MKHLSKLLICLVAMAPATQAFAHAHMTMSKPADGAMVGHMLKSLDIGFDDPVVLTNLELMSNGKDVPIHFKRSGNIAKSFSLPIPALQPGKYEVKWSIISEEDGHPKTGSFSFTVTAD